MNRTTIIIIACVAFAPLVAWIAYGLLKPIVSPTSESELPPLIQSDDTMTGDEDVTGDVSGATGMSIETYVRENISDLSPEPATMGGTFFVTDIEAQNGTGNVSYEDGHNAYTADFKYEIDVNGKITITSFVLRPTPVPR
jgi:hypothetical protein